MSTDTVRPALTPEEWARLRATNHLTRPIGYAGQEIGVQVGHPWSGVSITAEHSHAGLSREMSHALAAVALHGQPFGFTREDVVALRRVVEIAREHEDRGPRDEGWQSPEFSAAVARAESAVDRLAALLPPE